MPSPLLVRSEEQQIILDVGLKALHRINADATFEDWLKVGDALMVITEGAVEKANSGPWAPRQQGGGTHVQWTVGALRAQRRLEP
jgi:hypothetical protein